MVNFISCFLIISFQMALTRYSNFSIQVKSQTFTTLYHPNLLPAQGRKETILVIFFLNLPLVSFPQDSSDHSQSSTPLSRARRRRRLPRRGAGGAGEAGGGSGAHSDSEYSPQTWRHHYLTDANSNTMASPVSG